MVELHQLGYGPSGEEDSGASIEEIISVVGSRWSDMEDIHLSLADTGDVFRSYPLPPSEVLTLDDTRLDCKYYDPDTLALLEGLRDSGARTLQSLVLGPVHRGKSPSKAEYNVDLDSNIRVVKAGNIGRTGLTGEFDLITEEVYQRLASAHVKEGDVLLASTGDGTLGKATVYDAATPAIADGHVSIIRLKEGTLPEYAVWFLRSNLGQRQINRLFTGATGLIELPEAAVDRLLMLIPEDEGDQRSLVGDWVDEVKESEALENEARNRRQTAHDRFIKDLQSLTSTPGR